ncbi:MAG: hypothetical protein KGN01_07335 [Patescibacteria group bacterium]|nr:hypothetical protein [Patescibacteria group bacterium]
MNLLVWLSAQEDPREADLKVFHKAFSKIKKRNRRKKFRLYKPVDKGVSPRDEKFEEG